MLSRTLLLSVHALSICLTISAHADKFPDELIVRVEPDGRLLTLKNDFRFIDEDLRTWTAPAGTVVDGASIPKPLWSLVGGPLEGKYREASVIHDYYCDTKTRPWDQVHETFYEAMLANGVTKFKATLMYLAVYRFGPRWDLDFTLYYCPPGQACAQSQEINYHVDEFTPPFDEKQFNQIENEVELMNLSDEQEMEIQIEEYKAHLENSFKGDLAREKIHEIRRKPRP